MSLLTFDNSFLISEIPLLITSNLTNEYGVIFHFKENKLETVKFETEVKGSTNDDFKELDKLNEECEHLKEVTESMNGVVISCDYKEGDLLKKQSFLILHIIFLLLLYVSNI